ncbi:GNAT family N-acetyltransferase [Actinoplanes ianthinogenes]|uniref:GNAT family N-acetyltransferase n=1 Tax=Actinoplanes ianthinogenes TaxID=122358 RepID=UPI0016717CEC|nr:GNAT family N-acetyltransferase [Actinoplanes ianthinogenes]
MTAWVHGWAASRGTPAPVAVPGGWRIQVGLPGHRIRYVLAGADLADLAAAPHPPGTWIKAVTTAAQPGAALPAGWVRAETLHVMTVRFDAGDDPPPPPYTARFLTAGQVVEARVSDAGGATAAAAHLAPAGAVAVIDRVETDPAHRRRGLGSTVMRMLAGHAIRHGMPRGVLVATDDGRHLYQRLGWRVVAALEAAYLPEQPIGGPGPLVG